MLSYIDNVEYLYLKYSYEKYLLTKFHCGPLNLSQQPSTAYVPILTWTRKLSFRLQKELSTVMYNQIVYLEKGSSI